MGDKVPLSVSDFCDVNKRLQRITLRTGAVMGREVKEPEVQIPQIDRPRVGTDYAKILVEEEERRLLEGYQQDARYRLKLPDQKKHNQCEMEDLTSIGTLPNLNDVEPDAALDVYDHYDFTERQSKLPIEKRRPQIVRMVETNQVVIILGATGCGKTTQVPQFILDHHAKQRKRCNIIVTQPRRIAASSVARRVCEERGWDLQTIVGYQIGLDNKTSPDTRLTFCTTAVLREKLVRERNMLAYTHVIIDEVHERDLETDFIMLIVRKLLRTNSRTVKVILMSATIDPSRFADYFSLPIGGKLHPAPVLDIEKRTNFDVQEFYVEQLRSLDEPLFQRLITQFESEGPQVHRDAMELAVKLIMQFDEIDYKDFLTKHGRHPTDVDHYKHAVLVFLPGIHEIEAMHDLLQEKAKGHYNWHQIPLHSSIAREEQQDVFKKPSKTYRKIILSTNIAESSITVPDVVYVIDFCLLKHLLCDPVTNFTSLRCAWASHSNCKQRAGRAGRLQNGRVYRMVPRRFYEIMLPAESDPEMVRCPLTLTVLKTKQLKMGGPDAILGLALDPPDLSRLETTILLLKEAGALLMTSEGKYSKFDGDITFLGVVMSHLPIDIQLTRLIMLGNIFSILEDAIVMAAWMTVRNVFESKFHDKLAPYASKINFTGGSNSDCIAYLHAHQMFAEKHRTNYFRTSNDNADKWCKRNFLNYKGMVEANELVDEIRMRLKNIGVFDVASQDKQSWEERYLPTVRKVVIAGAFYPNYFVRPFREGAANEADAVKALAGKDPFSTVYIQGLPQNQPGELYAKVVKDIFDDHAGVVSNVSFDGSSKVYIEFKRDINSNLPGKISYPVYRSIKMRQVGIKIQIPLLPAPEAQKRADLAGIGTHKLSNLGKLKNSVRTYLPNKSETFLEFDVSWVNDPSDFYIQTCVDAKLESIQTKLNTSGNLIPLSKKVQPNHIYAAPYPCNSKQAQYYRAKLITMNKPPSKTGLILFIDYGNTEEVCIELLCELGPNIQPLRLMPPLALQCTLSGISPSSLQNNGMWSEEAVKKVKSYFGDGRMLGEIYSVVDGVVSLNVKKPGNKSINEILIEDGVAEKVEESHRSRMDNLERLNSSEYHTTDIAAGDCDRQFNTSEVQHKTYREKYIDPPSRLECGSVASMRGPSSPLEIRVSGCTRVTEGKEICIDQDSVNSVLLDSNPEDPHERLLVAGYVGTNPSGDKMKIGHTTFMPNIHGLSALMCLIFSPTVELRLSKDESRLIGALCGLGCDAKSGIPYFPEHDMEMTFDCEIDLDDIVHINVLRFNMSKPLETAEGEDSCDASLAEILRCQKRAMELLTPLLSKIRGNQEVEMFPRPLRWLQYNPNKLLEPDIEADRAVFRPHYGLQLPF